MAEMEKTMSLITQNSRNLVLTMVPRVPELYPQPPGQRQRSMPNITLTNQGKNLRGDWGHQLIGGKREGRIRTVFQNMGGMGNKSDQPV